MARDVYDNSTDQEIDLIFWNDQAQNGLHFLPPIIAFECKNWYTRSVNGRELSWFASKLRNKGLNLGIVVSRSGITGNKSRGTDGYGELQNILHDGCKILEISLHDLEKITDTNQVVAMLREKLRNLVIPLNVR